MKKKLTMSLNIEFVCGLDNVDYQDLVLNDDNIFDYTSFDFIFKFDCMKLFFSSESMYISSYEISTFINKLVHYENNSIGELFEDNEYYSICLKDKKISFAVTNCEGGFSNMCFMLTIDNQNIQDILILFNKLLNFKKRIEDSYVSSDIEEEYEIDRNQTNINLY